MDLPHCRILPTHHPQVEGQKCILLRHRRLRQQHVGTRLRRQQLPEAGQRKIMDGDKDIETCA